MLKLLSSLTKEELAGKRVFVRADLDVEIDEAGNVLEDFRLQAMRQTFEFLSAHDVGQIIVAGHLGRPQNGVGVDRRVDPQFTGGHTDPPLQLNRVSNRLSEIIGQSIKKLDEVTFDTIPNDKIVMLENLRFDPREEANDLLFAQQLASYADIYVNECFADCHRAHASMVGVPKFLPSYAGLRLAEEVKVLSLVLEKPERPLVVIIGGAKLETKEPVIKNFIGVADKILVGGRIGFDVGVQFIEPAIDRVFPTDDIDKKDIGPKTIEKFVNIIKTAKTIIWNGPMGIFEEERYATGTKAIAEAVAYSSAKTIVGGGDTVACLQRLGLLDKMGFVSTGGGAMLEFLSGQELPALAVLANENS